VFNYINAVAAGDTSVLPEAFDLSIDGVGYSTSGGMIDDITGDLDAYQAAIISGEIQVSTTP
jgi:basic membrane protein A and related proteins